MKLAIDLALKGIDKHGHGPFGAVVVSGSEVIGVGTNRVTSTIDPTAHAEVCAIRDACKRVNSFALRDCDIYTSCEPCPMCLGAIYWARIKRVYYGASREDAAKVQFDDQHFYEEFKKSPEHRTIPMLQVMRSHCLEIFSLWQRKTEKVLY